MIKKFKIFEIADNIDSMFVGNYDGGMLTWRTPGSFPFAFTLNKKGNIDEWWDGESASMHEQNFGPDVIGRVWTNEKIISFWEYPPDEFVKKCFGHIEWNFDISLFDNDWRIEIRNPDAPKGELGDFTGKRHYLIPIEDYIHSNNNTDTPEYRDHLDLKKNKKVTDNNYFGANKKLKYQLPNETSIEAKNRLKYMYQEKRNLILEYEDFYDSSDYYQELANDTTRHLLSDICDQIPIKFKVIPKMQYKNALIEFVRYGEFMRFPSKIIFKWKALLLENIFKLSSLSDIHGHSQHFPYDEFHNVFNYDYDTHEFSDWLKSKGKDDKSLYNFYLVYEFLDEVYNLDNITPQFSNGHDVLSDYATAPLMKLAEELDENETPEEIIVTINKILDVTHQRSDIAELFIEGGSSTLDEISN
jgi:hypothetical protein